MTTNEKDANLGLEVYKQFITQVPETQQSMWFPSPLVFESDSSNRLDIIVPNTYSQKHIKDNYLVNLTETAKKIIPDCEINIVIDREKWSKIPDTRKTRGIYSEGRPQAYEPKTQVVLPYMTSFNDLVMHEGNEFALNLGKYTLEEMLNGGEIHNIIFTGQNGTGKSMLMSTILNEASKQNLLPWIVDVYKISSFFQQTRGKEPFNYRHLPRAKIIGIDGLEKLEGLKGCQNAIYKVINDAMSDNVPIIACMRENYDINIGDLISKIKSSCLTKCSGDLADRLSHFEIISLSLPSENRIDYIKQVLLKKVGKIPIKEKDLREVSKYLDDLIPRGESLRVIDSIVGSATILSKVNKSPLTYKMAQQSLKSTQQLYLCDNAPAPLEELRSQIIYALPFERKISLEDCLSYSRNEEHVKARCLFLHALKELSPNTSMQEMGKLINRKPKTVRELMEKPFSTEELGGVVKEVKSQLENKAH